MDTAKEFFRRTRNFDKRADSKNERAYRKKFIIKSEAKVKVYDGYINIKNQDGEFIISFRNISAVYLNINVDISLYDLFLLSRSFKLYMIDGYGYILGRVINYEKR